VPPAEVLQLAVQAPRAAGVRGADAPGGAAVRDVSLGV
jgi:hypothetical protein